MKKKEKREFTHTELECIKDLKTRQIMELHCFKKVPVREIALAYRMTRAVVWGRINDGQRCIEHHQSVVSKCLSGHVDNILLEELGMARLEGLTVGDIKVLTAENLLRLPQIHWGTIKKLAVVLERIGVQLKVTPRSDSFVPTCDIEYFFHDVDMESGKKVDMVIFYFVHEKLLNGVEHILSVFDDAEYAPANSEQLETLIMSLHKYRKPSSGHIVALSDPTIEEDKNQYRSAWMTGRGEMQTEFLDWNTIMLNYCGFLGVKKDKKDV